MVLAVSVHLVCKNTKTISLENIAFCFFCLILNWEFNSQSSLRFQSLDRFSLTCIVNYGTKMYGEIVLKYKLNQESQSHSDIISFTSIVFFICTVIWPYESHEGTMVIAISRVESCHVKFWQAGNLFQRGIQCVRFSKDMSIDSQYCFRHL